MGWQKVWQSGAIAAAVSVSLLGLLEQINLLPMGLAIAAPKPVPIQKRPAQRSSDRMPSPTAKVIAANNRFGFKLFSEILKQDRDKNLFVSPTSVAIALAMTYNGASGNTQQAMAKTLELQDMSLQTLNQGNANLVEILADPEAQVQLSIANSLWAKKGFPFKSEFMQRNRQFYNAQVTDLDFKDPKAVAVINQWVKQSTHGKITKIVEKIEPLQVMFLINAVYFKSAWRVPFDKQATVNKPFHLLQGKSKLHPMMLRTGTHAYLETEQFQAAHILYGTGGVSMVVFLPKEKSSLAEFYKTLTAESWQQWITQFHPQSGLIQLPRFKLEYNSSLNQVLSNLGMKVAFDQGKAEFDNLSSSSVYIDEVMHKTFVEVNEAGTEAAAATSVSIATRSSPQKQKPFRMVCDRPFFFAIVHNNTGAILFMGAIVEPQ